jgi:hypothetical protein
MPEYWVRRAVTVLVTPVGLALIAAVRLLIVSNYNVTTAVTVAESGGYVNTFLGSLIPLVPAFLPYLALWFLAFRRFILCALTIVATALISPAVRPPVAALRYFDEYWTIAVRWTSVHLAFAAAIAFGIWVLPWHYLRGHWVHWLFQAVWACAAVFALSPYLIIAYPAPSTQGFYTAYLRQPWLSAEQISVNPDKIYQGYVLASDDQWMTVLLFQSRTVAYFRADSVTARIVCESPAKPSPAPLVRLLYVKSSSLPECRDSDSWVIVQHRVSRTGETTRSNSKVAAAPIRGAKGRITSPLKRPACCRSEKHGGRKEPEYHFRRKAVRLPSPRGRFDHHGMATSGRGRTQKASVSPRSHRPGRAEVLSGEEFLLWATYRGKSFGDVI